MNWTRVLMLGLLIGGCVTEGTAQEMNGVEGTVETAGRNRKRDRSRRSSRDNGTTRLFRLMGKDTIWTPVGSIKSDNQADLLICEATPWINR